MQAAQTEPPVREPDFIDRTVDEGLSDWEPLIDPLFASIDDVIKDCADLGELQSRLVDALGAMDVSAFQELIARGTFAARVTGLADKSRDQG
jgi:phage gp29-like protein